MQFFKSYFTDAVDLKKETKSFSQEVSVYICLFSQ